MQILRVVVFDGDCNFCNATVNFIIRRDPEARFRFAASQGEVGRALLARHGLTELQNDTFVLIEGSGYKIRSDAALELARNLTWPWSIFWVCRWVPRMIRDQVYDFVARNRHKLFGRKKVCSLPNEELSSRFVFDVDDFVAESLGDSGSLNAQDKKPLFSEADKSATKTEQI